MGRLMQALFGTVIMIMGLLGMWEIVPASNESIPHIWWGTGMIMIVMSWRKNDN